MPKLAKVLDAIGKPKGLPKKLTDEQIRLGSMYLAMSNLGMDGLNGRRVSTKQELRFAYGRCDQACAEGQGDYEGSGAEPERKSFEKELRSKKKSAYWIGELMKEVPFIFAEGE
jgi:hypothetical protein